MHITIHFKCNYTKMNSDQKLGSSDLDFTLQNNFEKLSTE